MTTRINKTTQLINQLNSQQEQETIESTSSIPIDQSTNNINSLINERLGNFRDSFNEAIKNETLEAFKEFQKHLKDNYISETNFTTKFTDLQNKILKKVINFKITKDLDLDEYRIINLADPIDETDAINKRKVDESIKYIHDVYDTKFSSLREILKQPTKHFKLVIPELFKKELVGDLNIRNEYQNIYCIFGKLEIISNKPINPFMILPEPHRTNIPIALRAICYTNENMINFINVLIKDNQLIFYLDNNLAINTKTIIEFNSLVSLPPRNPLHIKI